MSDITINEVRRRLQLFAKEHANDRLEKQYAQQFMRDFYACFGLSKSSASMFEKKVIKFGSKAVRFIDSFIPGVLLVEQKTTGEDLYKAYEQALDYALAITNEFEKPRYILICDFQTFNLYDLHNLDNVPLVCKLEEISKRADWFMFLVDKRVVAYSEELPVNRKAVEQIAKLHDALLKANYIGRDLESFLTRLLFCLFADDTGIFGEDGQFRKLIERTKEDGSDLGTAITMLFQVLNTPHSKRQTNLDERLKAFEYVNGALFEEQIQIPSFDFDLRTILIKCAELNWSGISPAIFGAMFQSVLESGATNTAHRIETRRELGAHYTSERNILKVIQPLFLDELHNEFEQAITKPKLQALYDKLHTLKFFDPACGCGNFLVIAYRELRRIENDVIAKLFFREEQGGLLDVKEFCKVSIEQFYGIEIDEAAVHIARVAMYITDHQLNLESGAKFGNTRATVPLISTPNIHCGNALRIDWNSVINAEECSYVFGNPPFIGKDYQTKEQKADSDYVMHEVKNYGLLDYVSNWFVKAANYIQSNSSISVGFVSTNSITQGEQVSLLWAYLLKLGVKINYAYRTFKWNNEGRGNAAVHCVITGWSLKDKRPKLLVDYKEDINGEGTRSYVDNINPYLVNAANIVLTSVRVPIVQVPIIVNGSKPTDGGNLLLSEDEKDFLLVKYPSSAKFIRKFLDADCFINNIPRYCLWLEKITPEELKSMPEIYSRVQAVRKMRLESTKLQTQELASVPYLFAEIRQPNSDYLAVPKVSSERREYVPFAMVDKETIIGDRLSCIPDANLAHFAVITSSLHMSWMRAVCGRMKSDYNYSNKIVYNNFPWQLVGEDAEIKLTKSAETILDARNLYPNASLADLYDPITMPIELVKAHEANNKAVDKAYGYTGADDDASRVAFLFKRYEELTSLLPPTVVKKKRAKKQDDAQTNLI